MSALIEHDDSENGDDKIIRVGEASAPVSVKFYQDVYHQITGRTEKIRKRYSENILIEFSELEQLHHKVMQLCDVHTIAAKNEVISVFHEKERKEQFTSFERFRTYNSNASSPSVMVVLKYNFSIIPAGLLKPQEYVVTIRLTSRVAMIKQMEQDAPPFMSGRFIGFLTDNTAEITIEYADYVIARGYQEAFDEWIKGCKTTPKSEWLIALRKKSYLIPNVMKICTVMLLAYFSLQAVPEFFNTSVTVNKWARFLIIYSAAMYILLSITQFAGEVIENAIDTYPVLSYLKLNRGDIKLIDEFQGKKKMAILKFITGCVLTIILSIISSKLNKII